MLVAVLDTTTTRPTTARCFEHAGSVHDNKTRQPRDGVVLNTSIALLYFKTKTPPTTNMYFRKILKLRRRKHSRKDVLLLVLASFLAYTVFLKLSVQLEPETGGILHERRREFTRGNVTGVTVMAAREGLTSIKPVIRTVTNKPVDTHGCKQWFEPSFMDNLKHISQYPRGVADRYMHKLTRNRTKPQTLQRGFPVIATAASGRFYSVTQGLLKSIYENIVPKYKNIKVIYYDMGISRAERQQLEKHCDVCEVRQFPFDDMPEHVRMLQTYTWKPIIVKTLLMEFGWVWWMDSSVRFVTSDLDRALKYSQDNSILFFTYDVIFSVAQHSDVQTMQYLGEDTCKFRHFGEIEATFVLFHYDNVTDIVVDQWVSCALNNQCMAPPGTDKKLSCSPAVKHDGRCHRFDQAVLGILLRRLYHEKNDYPLVSDPFHIHEIMRGQSVSFFPD